MVKLKLFDGEEASEEFVEDFKTFMELSKEKKGTLISLIGKSEYSRYYCIKKNELATALELEEETAHVAFHVVFILLKKLIKDELPGEDIIADIRELGYSDGQIKELNDMLKNVQTLTFKKQFMASFQAQLELRSTLPILYSLDCVIDQRIVTIDGKVDGEILKTIPIAILKMTTTEQDKKNTITVQSTIEEIERFVEDLQEVLTGLKKLRSIRDTKI